MHVAVYGSLLSGFHNHSLIQTAPFVGHGKLEGFALFPVATSFPGIVRDGDSTVVVEVYDCSDTTMLRLDWLEGYDPNNLAGSMYVRETVPVLVDGKPLECAVYVWNDAPRRQKIESGSWRAYMQERRS